MCCNCLGEEVLKTVGSFLVVELMRQGKTPQQACEEAILRILNKPNKNYKDFQVGYIAANKHGETGSYSLHSGFSMSKYLDDVHDVVLSEYFNKT